jgi:hypothetical protein
VPAQAAVAAAAAQQQQRQQYSGKKLERDFAVAAAAGTVVHVWLRAQHLSSVHRCRHSLCMYPEFFFFFFFFFVLLLLLHFFFFMLCSQPCFHLFLISHVRGPAALLANPLFLLSHCLQQLRSVRHNSTAEQWYVFIDLSYSHMPVIRLSCLLPCFVFLSLPSKAAQRVPPQVYS